MPDVIIRRPTKSATQSGRAKTKDWLLSFEPSSRPEPDPLMGWNGSADTRRPLALRFPNREAALAFARRQGWSATVLDEPEQAPFRPKSYADAFAPDRRS